MTRVAAPPTPQSMAFPPGTMRMSAAGGRVLPYRSCHTIHAGIRPKSTRTPYVPAASSAEKNTPGKSMARMYGGTRVAKYGTGCCRPLLSCMPSAMKSDSPSTKPMKEVATARNEKALTAKERDGLASWRACTGSFPAEMLPVLPRMAASHARNIPKGSRVPRTMAWRTLPMSPSRFVTITGTTFWNTNARAMTGRVPGTSSQFALASSAGSTSKMAADVSTPKLSNTPAKRVLFIVSRTMVLEK
mmetsp:Transcript_40743/g.104297  ORF Transcript_40743/g.104297 Transcript_40743/m.104297 type:complete len:245 (+) Transcript_40743:257-991(+)